ncbi:MAG: PEPxxWA-CTERM sorting domain-containing protein, partial [Thermaurantiacus sp.]
RTAFSYVSDFDSGLAVNDMSCRVAQATNILGPGGAIFCDLGRGLTEVGVAGGDSGGPQFDALGRIVSVTSYGLSFGTGFGDCRTGLQSSCGEMNGFVPLYANADFIRSVLFVPETVIPEAATWAMMIAGFGFVGGALRRRRKETVAA